jgi:SET domain-containing protein
LEIVLDGLRKMWTLPTLRIGHIEGKGRAVFATTSIPQGAYVCEYVRDCVYPLKDRPTHEEEYKENGEGCMILDIHTKHGWLCLDATRCHDTVGRLLNHAPHRRATVRPFRPLLVDGEWRVGFLANREIKPGEEICWDYGCSPEGQEWLMRNTRTGMQPALCIF